MVFIKKIWKMASNTMSLTSPALIESSLLAAQKGLQRSVDGELSVKSINADVSALPSLQNDHKTSKVEDNQILEEKNDARMTGKKKTRNKAKKHVQKASVKPKKKKVISPKRREVVKAKERVLTAKISEVMMQSRIATSAAASARQIFAEPKKLSEAIHPDEAPISGTIVDKYDVSSTENDSLFRNVLIGSIFAILVYAIMVVKVEHAQGFATDDWFFVLYSFAVTGYVLSRLLIAYFYKPQIASEDAYTLENLPTATFGIPCLNEEENIRETIVRIAASDYPKDKFDIIVVNDGSTDNTLEEMKYGKRIAQDEYGVHVEIVDWKENRGKRDGMAETIKRSDKDIMVFIDSDSFVQEDTVKNLVKYFVDPQVGAVAGQAYVANAEKNYLTKMQEVRYFVAFKAHKSAEAIFGSVTCCSGCCAAYRREYIVDVMDEFLDQRFLGVRCTYGDDRSLTNFVLKKGYSCLFAPDAISHTFAPDTFKQFIKQQMRWKKSWTRETLLASKFMWKRHIIMSLSHYVGLILPLLAPIVVVRALIVYPIQEGGVPFYYLGGLLLMAFVYGLYYYIYARDDKWMYGVVFSFVYTILLIWQLPWAILNIRDPKWGTR